MPNIRLNRRALVKLRGGSRKLPWEKLLRCVLGKPEFGNVMKGVWWGERGDHMLLLPRQGLSRVLESRGSLELRDVALNGQASEQMCEAL